MSEEKSRVRKVITETVAKDVGYMDLVGAGLVKYFGERALTPVIGNGTLMSGAVKLGGGLAARKFMGKGTIKDSLALGLSIDGIEDIMASFLGTGVGKTNGILATFGLGGSQEDTNW